MKTPSERLIPVLQTIETATAVIYKLYPMLVDKDVEYVYAAFHTFFKGEVQGKELSEPSSTSKIKEDLIDLIFQQLETAEEEGAFNELLDGSFAPAGRPVTVVEELYVMAFNYLTKSAALWRKNRGRKGYLTGPIQDLGEIVLSEEE